MKTSDWACPKCGNPMVKISDRYITCLCGQARLFSAWGTLDLPIAKRLNRKRFEIDGESGQWEYVPHAHKNAMNHCPALGVVVALVVGKRVSVRAFRQAKPPRKKVAK